MKGQGHQLKINKEAAGDTGSLRFQTGWSGRAEMGLAGSGDFSIKVSPDGETGYTAIAADSGTGGVKTAALEISTGISGGSGLRFGNLASTSTATHRTTRCLVRCRRRSRTHGFELSQYIDDG
jgi:hypothetical protein